MGFTAFSPLAQGLLTNRYLNGIPAGSRAASGRSLKPERITPQLVEKLKSLDAIASRRGQTLAQMSVSWLLKDPRVTSVIVGSSSVAQLSDTMGCLSNIVFSPEDLAEIDNILLG